MSYKAVVQVFIPRSGSISAPELARATKIGEAKAEAAMKSIGGRAGLSRPGFHALINQNRIRNPTVARGDRAFTHLDRNRVRYRPKNLNFVPRQPYILK